MSKFDNILVPEELGRIKGRYLWDESRHCVKNYFMAGLCVLCCLSIAVVCNFDIFTRTLNPIAQMSLTFFFVLFLFFSLRAIYDLSLRHIKVQAILCEKGFCLFRYNENEDVILTEYVQSYSKIDHIEKHTHTDFSEDGIYLRTICSYTFYAPNEKCHIELEYNRKDRRLVEGEGLSDVKAMRAIESDYNLCQKNARVTEIADRDRMIPSRPQPILRINDPIMWKDII